MDVIFQDSSLLVVNKPAGSPVLADGWDAGAPYLVKAIKAEYGAVWLVHRLDKATSGVLVLARTPEAHRDVSIQFEKREVEKTYHAIAEGNPAWTQKIARHPLRANVGHRHRTAVDRERGKASRTEFRVLQQLQGHVLLGAHPVTGRTHQVRAHATALGYPLLGDGLYGASPTELIARPALHAYSLRIRHPESGESLFLAASYPRDFAAALSALQPPA